MHWNILIYKVTSTSKAFTLPYHIASYAWCPEIICAVSLSCTSLHPWDSPLIPLAFILPEAYHTAFWTFVWTLFSIMLKLETKCLATYCPSWLIDFWQQLIQSGIGRYSRSSVELSCSWKQRSPETPLATSCMGGGMCHGSYTCTVFFGPLILFVIFFLRKDKWVLHTPCAS